MNVKFKAHLFIFSLFFCYNLSAKKSSKEILRTKIHKVRMFLHLTWMLPTNR